MCIIWVCLYVFVCVLITEIKMSFKSSDLKGKKTQQTQLSLTLLLIKLYSHDQGTFREKPLDYRCATQLLFPLWMSSLLLYEKIKVDIVAFLFSCCKQEASCWHEPACVLATFPSLYLTVYCWGHPGGQALWISHGLLCFTCVHSFVIFEPVHVCCYCLSTGHMLVRNCLYYFDPYIVCEPFIDNDWCERV